MRLELSPEEATLLDRVLRTYVTELQGEIRATDNFRFRQGLKQERETLRKLLEELHGVGSPPTSVTSTAQA